MAHDTPAHSTLQAIAVAAILFHMLSTAGAAQIVTNTGIIPQSISESSGVAASRTYPGVIWTHNDSGHRPFIYALRFNGELLSSLRLNGARGNDWEDMATGPCPSVISDSGNCIYVADTGDNFERRRTVSIYVVPEPDPFDTTLRQTERVRRIDFSYPDGPVDVESLGIGPDLFAWLVSKGRNWPVRLFSLDIEQAVRDSGGQIIATAVDTLGLPHVPLVGWVTAAAVSPSGRKLLVRTYVDIYTYLRTGDGRWRPAEPPVCHLGAIEPQGEAIDFVDEDMLVLTSEALPGRPGPIHTVVCP